MRSVERRIEKIEGRVQSIKKEADDRQTKLLEIQRLEKTDSLKALFLRAELEYGRKVTLAGLIHDAHRQDISRSEK